MNVYIVYMATNRSRLTGRERALAYLRDTVLADPSLEGTFVNEQQLAAQVGVSRTPVREALLILASEGLLHVVPQRGMYVAPLTGREIRELMDLRGVLEKHAAAVAAADPDKTTARMDEVVAEQHAVADDPARRDEKLFIELDRQFHQILIDAAHNDLLSRTYAGLGERQIRVGIAALAAGAERWKMVCGEHQAIVAAVRAGSVLDAHRAIDEHLRITLEHLLTV
jgi:DNA-binding GntR family transcriptional regulator